MEAERFGQWTIIPYQFPKSMWIAGNLTANEQFFAELSGAPTLRFPSSHCSPATQLRMKLTPDDLKRIAHLARIAVSDADVAQFQTQLNGIFGLIEELQAVDTKGVEPLSHPLDVMQDMTQRLRDDLITEKVQRAANMANAPSQENGLFLVPKVLD